MARRLRWKRIIGVGAILLVLIVGLCFGLLKACSKDEGGSNETNTTVASDKEQSTDTGENGNSDNGNGENADGGTNAQTEQNANGGNNTPQASWPSALNGMVKEYTGAGDIIDTATSTSDDGKTVYKMKYKGTSIDSCFSYSKNTLGMKGEWTEAITGELYTFSRETDKYVLNLSCEPKVKNGYDLLISVKVK